MTNNHMETFTTLLFFFFLPFLASACRHRCDNDGPPVRFPFWIVENNNDASHCGFDAFEGFSLSCDTNQKQTRMYLPSSGDFVVTDINYLDQIVTITTTECLIKSFLEGEMILSSTQPFSYLRNFVNYTFFTCSWDAEMVDQFPTVSCLSHVEYSVVAVETSRVPSRLDPNCQVYYYPTAMVPIGPSQTEWEDINYSVKLKWDDPDCKACAGFGKAWGIIGTSVIRPQVGCLPSGSKFARIASVIGLVLSGVLWLVVLAWRLTRNSTSSSRSIQRPANTEMSTLTIDGQLPFAVAGGLDRETIDSYPKIQLGESQEFTSSGENACPICLGEYEVMEIIRTIPECNHYFHANCIDNWLRRNPTCPVCRTLPEGSRTR